MKKIVVLLTVLLWSTAAFGNVSMRLFEADGNTPFDSNSPIMVGTRLTIYADSNSAASMWLGGFDLVKPVTNPDLPRGMLIGRGWDANAIDYSNSRLSSAGNRARIIDWENEDQQSFELFANGSNMAAGTWFVVDYNATNIGDCVINLVEYHDSNLVTVQSTTLHQVATRDFNNDGQVNFIDFAKLASYWLHTDCNELNNCEGTDLNPVPDGTIDYLDVMYFAEFWLGRFRQPDSLGDINDVNIPDSNSMPSPPSGSPVLYLVYDGNTPPDPNTDLTIHVYSEQLLSSMEVGIQISGDAIITGAMDADDCEQYGWDPGWWSYSEIDPNGTWATTGNVAPQDGTSGTVGYFTIHYNSGPVNVAIMSSSYAYDVNALPVVLSTDPLILGGENQQQSMMMQSGLESSSMSEQQVVDVNSLVDWCENLWNIDAELRSTTTEADWNAFIESIRTSQ